MFEHMNICFCRVICLTIIHYPMYPCSFKSSSKDQGLQPKSSSKSPSSDEPSKLTCRPARLNRCRALSCLQTIFKLLKTAVTEDIFWGQGLSNFSMTVNFRYLKRKLQSYSIFIAYMHILTLS